MSGTLTLAGMDTGLVSGSKTIGPFTMTGIASVGEILDSGLVSGDTTFVIPAGAYAVAIFLGGGAVSVTVKVRTNLNSTDGGLVIAPYTGTGFAVFPLPAGSTSLILNASSSVSGVELSFI